MRPLYDVILTAFKDFQDLCAGSKQENDMLDSLLLTYDKALKGGTQAVFADTTSRPR